MLSLIEFLFQIMILAGLAFCAFRGIFDHLLYRRFGTTGAVDVKHFDYSKLRRKKASEIYSRYIISEEHQALSPEYKTSAFEPVRLACLWSFSIVGVCAILIAVLLFGQMVVFS